ncbi:hypothetical protein R69776_08228 [Paraburkholderia nemoris]|uniref:Uncharacterized protein n=1 Tax=Paraburkholderia nemoris TaxID=2793076 RepID=A0ABM8T7Z6_9BURK|nr:hypothetical protein R69776_08228 [Paraburkholderia nemoris]
MLHTLNGVLRAPSAIASPRSACAYACCSSSSRMRHDTPSTARWWIASSTRWPCRPTSRYAAFSSGPCRRSSCCCTRVHASCSACSQSPLSPIVICSSSGSCGWVCTGATRWVQPRVEASPTRTNLNRSASCRATSACNARSSTATSSPPRTRSRTAWFQCDGASSNRSKKLRWIGVSGTTSCTSACSTCSAPPSSTTTRACASIVG